MRRTVGLFLCTVVAAAAIPGCVVDPYYHDRHHGHVSGDYGRPHDDDDFYGQSPRHRDDDRNDYRLPTLVCASKNGRATRCRTDFRIERAEIDKRYSGSPCEYGRSWGYDGNEVWVDRGCRARFVLTPAGRWR